MQGRIRSKHGSIVGTEPRWTGSIPGPRRATGVGGSVMTTGTIPELTG